MTPIERNTRQRAAIRQALLGAGRPLSPQEVLEAAQAGVPTLGIATVYRTLKALVEEGTIATVDLPGEAPRYEPAHQGHHHHFHCRGCSRVFEIHGCPKGLPALAPPGFAVEGHEVVLYGRCEACRG